ncbi:uncharacterized protein UTRI_03938_B [Ustilago trichophora]|uniref:Uncharacterized protein n=1 Tax=Ustilago trichophora TaxID=86804 RepID=A0A5C3EAD8_9BASI|nr:uncharacterized protein UTRI_03938_B [Ustilago trichophora]
MKPLLRPLPASRLGVSSAMQRSLLANRALSTMRVVRPAPTPSQPTSRLTRALPIAPVARPYSTAPNSHQVMQSFGTPFAQFIYTISRIARIITFTALGVATIGVVSFEAAHQYVEHVAMPSSAPFFSSSASEDEFGWTQQALEESWSGSTKHTGTDPRLGIKGRHAVRSAWMCVNWGGGISPGVMFGGNSSSSGLGRTAVTSMEAAKTLKVEDGMILAMQYLNLAVKIAASKGIKLPDTDGIRAGLVSESVAREQLKNVDPLAVALEGRLAAVKERQGSRGALESAIASYERLYDIASMSQSEEGADGERASKLVRLATKLGDLHSALEEREEAEEWLNRAVGIAASAGASTPDLHNMQTVTVPGTAATEKKKSRFGGWFSSSAKSPSPVVDSTPSTPAAPATASSTAAAAVAALTPALTRALITALVSKSAFHAHTPTTSSLQTALQTQISALQLSAAEQDRLLTPAGAAVAAVGAELHNLWLTHHQSVLDLHVAETIFALTRKDASGSSSKLLPTAWFKGHEKKGSKSIEWVDQADMRAAGVIKALEEATASAKGAKKDAKKQEDKLELAPKWTNDKAVKLTAGRVLRDAKRVQSAAGRCRVTLEGL